VVIGNRVLWNLGALAPDQTQAITLTARVAASVQPGADLENCAEVSTTTWERNPGNNRACDRRQAVPDEVDLSVNKGASPGDPAPGHEYVYWISFNNNRPASALNVRITDTLPVSTTFVSEWHPAGWRVDTSRPGVVVWQRDEFPGWRGEYVELRVRVNANVAPDTQLRNHVEISTTSNDVDRKNNAQDYDVRTRQPYVNLQVGKWYANGSPVAGQIYGTWVQVQNEGNVPGTGVVLTDTFPANTTLGKVFRYDRNPATGDYDIEVFFPPDAQGPGWARWNLGDLVNWRQVQMRVDFRIGSDVPPWTELVNRVDVSAAEPDADPNNNHAEYRFTTQPPGPNVRAFKYFNWGELLPGNTLQYWLHFDNDGTQPAYNVTFTDTLPAGVTFQGHGFWQEPTVVGNQLVWNIDQMNPGDAHGLWVQVRIDDDTPVGAVLTNTAESGTSSAEVRYDDNAARVARRVGPDLRVEKELQDKVLPGHQIRYRIRIWNNGQTWARNVVLTDTLPADCAFAWSWWGGEVQDGRVIWRLGDLNPGWYGDFEMGVDVGRGIPGGTVVTNTVEITNDLGDADPADNRFALTSTVESPYHIRVQETHNWVDGQVLPNAHVQVVLREGGGAIKQTVESDADNNGNFGAGFGPDIAPGDTVEVNTEGTPTIVIPVIRIEGAVGAAADLIAGRVYSVTYPAALRGEVWAPEGPPPVEGQTDGSGNYSLSFVPFDVKSGHQVALWYVRPDGHQVGIVRSVLFVRVYPTDDHVNGATSPNTLVNVSLRNQAGRLKGTAQVVSDGNGDWGTDVFTGTQRVEIDDHDTVTVTAGTNSTGVFLPRIGILPDAAHDWLQILSELPNTRLEVRWDSQPNMENHDLANGTEVTTGPQGDARVDFGPLGGLALGVHGNLYYYNADGNCVEPWWRAMVGLVDPDEFVDDQAQRLYIIGEGFQRTPRILLGTMWPPSVAITDVTFLSPQLLQVMIPAGTPAGVYDLYADNPDERIGFLAQALTIKNPTPTVTSVTPDHGYWDEAVNFILQGGNFVTGASVTLVQSIHVITATGITVVSATQITGTLDLHGAAPGLYDVVVKNPGPGQPSGTLLDGFRVAPRWWLWLPLVMRKGS